MSQLENALDGISFDGHPFFHRFAQMLPTALAILDHIAQAVFVDQHFYQLFTYRGENQELLVVTEYPSRWLASIQILVNIFFHRRKSIEN